MILYSYFTRELILIALGAIIALMANAILRYLDRLSEQKHNASILLYDLISIQNYFCNPKMEHNVHISNLRYTERWQTIIAKCSFLSKEHIMLLYDIYNNTYDYNYLFGLSMSSGYSSEYGRGPWLTKANIPSSAIYRLINKDAWKSLIECLERKI